MVTRINDEEQKMFDYIASSGAYGILSHKVVNEIEREGKGIKQSGG